MFNFRLTTHKKTRIQRATKQGTRTHYKKKKSSNQIKHRVG